jgi:hypothetical protein
MDTIYTKQIGICLSNFKPSPHFQHWTFLDTPGYTAAQIC